MKSEDVNEFIFFGIFAMALAAAFCIIEISAAALKFLNII